jgi:hypothetical protein
MADKPKTIYAKLAQARRDFHALDLKKSGWNDYSKYKYFELADFLIPGMQCLDGVGLVPVISFSHEYATMKLHDTETGESIEITSPMSSAKLKAAHEIQNLGAVETYERRYLWMAALEIVEHDAVDASQGAAPAEKVSESTVADIEAKMQEVGADGPKFMKWVNSQFGAGDLSELTTEQAPKVLAMLERKAKAA